MVSIQIGNGFLQIVTGTWPTGAVFVGGRHAFIERLDPDGTHVEMIPAVDNLGNPVDNVMGLAVNATTGTLYAVLTDSEIATDASYDVCVIPNQSGVLLAHVVDTGQVELRKYSMDGLTLLDTWTPAVPVGYGRQALKIDVACDSASVVIGWMLGKLTRFNISTGLDVAVYQTLEVDSPYLLGGVRWASRESGDLRDTITAMTRSGTGPQRAVAIASATEHWVDQINPSGAYVIQRRLNADGTFVDEIETQADDEPTPTNDYTLSLAVNVALCPVASSRVFGFIATAY